MTSTDHDAPAVELHELGSAQAQAHARDAWRRSGGRLTGAELGRLYGRSERWGRQQIEAVEATHPRPDAHHRVEHCTVITDDILRRMGRLGMIGVPFGAVYWSSVKLPTLAVAR